MVSTYHGIGPSQAWSASSSRPNRARCRSSSASTRRTPPPLTQIIDKRMIVCKLAEQRIDAGPIKLFGVKVAAGPFDLLLVLRMSRIGQRIEELRVAPNAAHIFRWSRSSAIHRQRILDARLWVQDPLDYQITLPAVTE